MLEALPPVPPSSATEGPSVMLETLPPAPREFASEGPSAASQASTQEELDNKQKLCSLLRRALQIAGAL